MKKIRNVILLITIVIALTISGYMYKCYQMYETYQNQTSIVTLMEETMHKENFVPFDALPDSLVKATIAIEDRRYYIHGGVDFIGVLRAIVSQVDDDFLKSGGSTITQQTAKNLYHMYESSLLIKGCQMWMAWELEKNYTKEEIFAVYVNIINYGDNNQGIYEAATNYFNVLPYQLSMEQSTILAGIPNLPGYYQLSDHYQNAKQRQYNVLVCMEDCGYITKDEIETIWNGSIY